VGDLNTIRSPENIDTRYPVFEPDQVLTHEQLNDVTSYLDVQQRLTRVELLGVGVIGGLSVALAGNKISISRGTGITTDGDLLMLGADTVYDRFRPYDQNAPKYAPFYDGIIMRTTYRLVRDAEDDELAVPLTQLPAPGLANMAVTLLLESYEKDQDLCSGTDCDNLGRSAVATLRVLLLSRTDAAAIQSTVPTPTQKADALRVLVADRPAITGSLTATKPLVDLYRNACENIHGSLIGAVDGLAKQVPAVTLEIFGGDPSPAWISRLNTIRDGFNGNGDGIQYYYDFLKDLVETWNTLRDALLDNDCVLCPDLAAFPKHLLLGAVSNPTQLRTDFYSSPLAGNGREHLEHARFLARKLSALINSFALPATSPAPPILVTPSRSETEGLENRAIPYYYAANDKFSLLETWSWQRTKRGTSSDITGYRAQAFGASAAAQAPLNGQIGCYDFFRIEGHLGQDLDRVMDKLESEISLRNLPFAVRAVLLHGEATKLKRKPPMRYSDMHRLHKLVRADIASELERTATFSTEYRQRIRDAAKNRKIPDDPDKMSRADDYETTIKSAVSEISKAFSGKTYSQFKVEIKWPQHYDDAVKTAGHFKQDFGDVSRTDFVTAFDSAIGSNLKNWLGWIDVLIDEKGQKTDERFLFANYLRTHPGLEHFGGVMRGGTFVVVYDDDAKVVADFMLPYREAEEIEEEREEPTLTDKLPTPIKDGLVLVRPPEWQFKDLKESIREDWLKEIKVQNGYVEFLKENVGIFGELSGIRKGGRPRIDERADEIRDPMAAYHARMIAAESAQLDTTKDAVLDLSLPEDVRKKLGDKQTLIEMRLAEAVTDAANYVASSNVDVAAGSDGERTLQIVSQGAGRVSNLTAIARMSTGLKQAHLGAAKEINKQMIKNLAKSNNIVF